MTTKNLIPRASGEGGIGITDVTWGYGYYDTGNFNKGLFLSGHNITQVIAETVTQGGLGGEWTKAVNGLDIYYNGGNVGIGTSDPNRKLQVHSNTAATQSIAVTTTLGLLSITHASIGHGLDKKGNVQLMNEVGNLKVFLKADGDSYLIGGNVGIGTTNPGAKLEILSENGPLIDASTFTLLTAKGGIAQGTTTLYVNQDLTSVVTPGDKIRIEIVTYIVASLGAGAIELTNNYSGATIGGVSDFQANLYSYEPVFYANSAGNVGIGTTNPSTALEINKETGGSSPIITLSRGGTSKSRFAIANATDSILDGALTDDLCFRTEGGNIRFGTASATKTDLSILSNGNVGIGTTNPTELLQLRSKKVTQLTGSVVLAAGNNVVNGTLTDFTNQLKVGEEVILEMQIYTILSIQSALQLTVSDVTPSWGNVSAAGIYRNTARSLMLADEKTAHIGVGFVDVANPQTMPATLTVARLDQNVDNAALSVFRGDTSAGDRPTAPIFNVINGEAGGTEVFRVQGNGNVGLTTASPANKLVIAGSSDTGNDLLNLCPALAIENTFGDYTDDQVFGIIGFSRTGAVANVNGSFVNGVRAGIVCRYEGNNTDLGANTGNVGTKLQFKTAPTNAGDSDVAMTILGNGNVGIGATDPAAKLTVATDNAPIGYAALIAAGGNNANNVALRLNAGLTNVTVAGDCTWIEFHNASGTTEIGSIRNTAALQVGFVNGSDIRIKKNINDTSIRGIDSIKALKLRSWDWNSLEEMKGVDIGLVADELEEVYPELISRQKLEGWEHCIAEGEEDLKTIPSESKITLTLVKAIQEQQQLIEDLKSRIETLENK